MSSVWTIIDVNGVEKSVAEWGLCEVARERINQMPDMVTFRAAGATWGSGGTRACSCRSSRRGRRAWRGG